MQTENWGLISYQEALNLQLEKLEDVADGAEDTLIFCSHPPVVTLGRATQKDDVTTWTGETVQISRGGRATYHGPSQIVAYPILNLNIARNKIPQHDLRAYLNVLENTLILTLREFGLKAEARHTGVWVQDKKIASIGIAVKKWVTYHGLALNLNSDPLAFTGIRPCGFNTGTMTSIEEQCGPIDRARIQNTLAKYFQEFISYQS